MTTETNQRYELARSTFNELAQRSYTTPKDATTALKRLAEFFPIVAPGGTLDVAQIAPGHSVLITAHVPQMCDDKGNGGDVFVERSSSTICFRAAFLKKLAGGVGLNWIPSETRVSFPFAGHPQSGWCCTVTVAAWYLDYAGQRRVVSATKTLDLRDDAKPKGTPKQIERERGDIQSRCETMAKSRCIADACIARTIAQDDVGAPIVCAQLYRTAPIDPGEARSALYGEDNRTPLDEIPTSTTPAEIVNEHTGEVTQGKPVPQTSSAPNAPSAGTTSNGGPGSGRRSASPASVGRLVPAGFPGAGKSIEALDVPTLTDLRVKVTAFIEAKRKEKVPEEKLVAVTEFLGDVEIRMDALRPPAGPATSDPEMDEWQRDYDAAGNK